MKGHARRVDHQAELLERRQRSAVELAGAPEIAAHRLELPEYANDRGLRLAVALDARNHLVTADDALVDGCWAVDRGGGILSRRAPFLTHVARPARVRDRPLEEGDRLAVATASLTDPGQNPAGPCKSEVVALLLAQDDRSLGGTRRLVTPAVRDAGKQPHELPDESGVRRQCRLAGKLGDRERVLEQAVGLLELAELHQRLSEVGEEREAPGVLRRERRRRPQEQVRRSVHVAANEGPTACRRESRRSFGTDGNGVLVRQPELDEIAMSLLEMVPGDLFELRRPVA